MEKDIQPDSISTTINVKEDYTPSEIYSSEPPPAYHRPESLILQVTKLIVICVIVVSLVLCSFTLASTYITATMSCQDKVREHLDNFHEPAKKLQTSLPAALVKEKLEDKPNTSHHEVERSNAIVDSVGVNTIEQKNVIQPQNKILKHATELSEQSAQEDFSKQKLGNFVESFWDNLGKSLTLPYKPNSKDDDDDGDMIVIRDESAKQVLPDKNEVGENFGFQFKSVTRPLTQQSPLVLPQQPEIDADEKHVFLEMRDQKFIPFQQILDQILPQILLSHNLEKQEIYKSRANKEFPQQQSLKNQDIHKLPNGNIIVNNTPDLLEMHFISPPLIASRNMAAAGVA